MEVKSGGCGGWGIVIYPRLNNFSCLALLCKKINSILLSLKFCCNGIQSLIIEISSDVATSWEKFRMNKPFYIPPNIQYNLLWMKTIFGSYYICLFNTEPLTFQCVFNIKYRLFILSNMIAKPLLIKMRCHYNHTSINSEFEFMRLWLI